MLKYNNNAWFHRSEISNKTWCLIFLLLLLSASIAVNFLEDASRYEPFNIISLFVVGAIFN